MSYPPAQQPQQPQPQQPQYQQPQPQYQQPQQPQYQQPAPQGAWQQGAPGQYPQQQPMGYQGAPGAPATPRPNPFAGIPVSDWIRDGAAVVLLLVSLALYWRIGDRGFEVAASRIDVLLITLLSTLSVSMGYLARAGVFGAGMPATRVALFRGLANAPYVVIVLLYIVFDVAQLGGVGLGMAAAVGLTGALLAGLPRRYEVYTPEFSAGAAKYSYFCALGLLGFAALTALLGTIFTIIQLAKYGSSLDAMIVIGLLFANLLPVLAGVALAVFVVRRSEVARLIGVAAGFAGVLGAFIAAFTKIGAIASLHNNFGYAILIFAIGAAIYTTPGLPFAMRGRPVLDTWGAVLRLVPIVAMAAAGLVALVAVFNMIGSRGNSVGFSVGVLVCAVLMVVAALVMRVQIVANLARGRMVIAMIAAGLLVIGLVAVILTGIGADKTMLSVSIGETIVFLLAPAGLVLYALFAQKEMREYFASVAPPQQAAYGYAPQQGQQMPPQQGQYAADQQYTGQQPYVPAAPAVQGQPQQMQQPAQPQTQQPQAQQQAAPAAPPAPPAPAAPANDDAARASDPSTPATELHAMSSNRELWPHLAANPSLYPALRDWLQSTGDPAVLEALQKNPAND